MKFILPLVKRTFIQKPPLSHILLIPLLAGSLVLAGCSSDDDDDGSVADNSTIDGGNVADTDGTGTDTEDAGTVGGGTDTDDGSTEANGTDTDDDSAVVEATDTDDASTDAEGTDTDDASTDAEGTDTDDASTDAEGTDTQDGSTDTDNTQDTDASTANSVIVTTVASDFSSSALEIHSLSEPRESLTGLNPGVSDTIVRAFEDKYYVIRRFMSDSIASFNSSDPSTVIFESSTNDADDPASSNPHDLVFVNSEKAYLLRYGSPIVWIVNPSATTAADFKTGEIDLGAYDPDGVPEATRGIVVGDQLFIFMQRLDENFAPALPGAVAVIDINTDAEVDTGTNDELMGIILPAFNPSDISFDAASNTIFASAFGDFGAFDGSRPSALTGGIVTVDTDNFTTIQLIDDTEETGRITAVEIIDADTGYMITETAFQSSTLVKFNPLTGSIETTGVAGFSAIDIRDITRGPAGNLWVALGDLVSPTVVVLDPADDSIVGTEINTSLIPTGITFVQ